MALDNTKFEKVKEFPDKKTRIANIVLTLIDLWNFGKTIDNQSPEFISWLYNILIENNRLNKSKGRMNQASPTKICIKYV